MPINGYQAKQWEAGNVITATALNTMEEGIEKVVLVSETDPQEKYNKIWVSNRGSSIEIPTYSEVGGIIEGTKVVKNLALVGNIIGKLTNQRPGISNNFLGIYSQNGSYIVVIIPVKGNTTYSININWAGAGSVWCKNTDNNLLTIDSNGIITSSSGEYFNNEIPALEIVAGHTAGQSGNYYNTEDQYLVTSPAEAEFLVLTGSIGRFAPGATFDTITEENFQLIVAETDLPIMGRTKYSYPKDTPAIVIPNLKINNNFIEPVAPYARTLISINSKKALLKFFNFKKFGLSNQEGGKLNLTSTDRFTTPDFCSFTENLTIRSKNSSKKFVYCTKNNDTSVTDVNSMSWISEATIPANTEFIISFNNVGTNTIEEYFNNDIEFIFTDSNNNKINSVAELNEKVEQLKENIGAKEYNIPDYYYTASGDWPGLDAKVAQIKSALPENGLSFIFFTDPHFSKNEGHSKELIRYVLDKTGIPFAICGGDIANVGGGKSALQNEVETYQEYVNAIGKERILTMRGNHDVYQSYSGYFDSIIRTSQTTFTLTERVKSDKTILSDNNYHFVLQYNPSVSSNLTLTKITIKYADNTNTEITSNFTGYWESDSNKILSSIDFTGTYTDSIPSADIINSIFSSVGAYFLEENIDKLFWGDSQYFPKYGTYIVRDKESNTILLILNTNDHQGSASIRLSENISNAQVEWVKSVLEEYKDWKIIVLSHISFGSEFNGERYSLTNGTYTFVQNWKSNITSDQANSIKTALETVNTTAGSRNVLCHLSGHAHYDYDNVTGKTNPTALPLIEIVTTTDSLQGEGWYLPNGASGDPTIQIQGGTKGTYTEQAFDVCIFNYTTNTLNMFRIGRGTDRTYNLSMSTNN